MDTAPEANNMDLFKILTTLPHHSQMGMFENDRSVPVWEAKHGAGWATTDLLACAERLEAAAQANQGVEWGDVRSRSINRDQARFLRRVAELRSTAA
jgi:hypothetical protein